MKKITLKELMDKNQGFSLRVYIPTREVLNEKFETLNIQTVFNKLRLAVLGIEGVNLRCLLTVVHGTEPKEYEDEIKKFIEACGDTTIQVLQNSDEYILDKNY